MKLIIPFVFLLALISCSPEDDIQPTPNPTGPTGSIYDSLVGYQFEGTLDTCFYPGAIVHLNKYLIQFISKDTLRYLFTENIWIPIQYEILLFESGRFHVISDRNGYETILKVEEFLPNGDIYGRRRDFFYCYETFDRSHL